MRLQFQILMFFVCLNLATGMAVALTLPGTEYVQPQSPGNATEYEEHFSPEEIAEGWSASPVEGIPLVGDIFSAFHFLGRNIQFLLDGFPMFLNWLSDTYVVDATAKASFGVIANVLRAIYAILMSFLLIEFIAGRYFTE